MAPRQDNYTHGLKCERCLHPRSNHSTMLCRGCLRAVTHNQDDSTPRVRDYAAEYLARRELHGIQPSRRVQPDTLSETLAERNAVFAAPLTIMQMWFGDPKPGRSALDRKRMGASG